MEGEAKWGWTLLRSGRKTLSVEVRRGGKVLVRAPRRLPLAVIEHWVAQKADWIEKQQARQENKTAPHAYQEGEPFFYLGRQYCLRCGSDREMLQEGILEVGGGPGECAAQVEAWYRRRAAEYLPARVRVWEERLGFSCMGVRVTGARARYGSCGAGNTLNFPWRLMIAPPETIDAVLVHELCHTAEHNHSGRFWALVRRALPDYKERCRWLSEHRADWEAF